MYGIRVWDCSQSTIKWKNNNGIIIWGEEVMVKSFWRCCIYLVKFIYWYKFDANLLTACGAITNFVSKRFDQKSRNGKDPPSEFCPISKNWGKLGLPTLAWVSLMKSYLMLQNAWFTAFTVFELLKENQYGEKNHPRLAPFHPHPLPPPPPRLVLNL